MDNEFSAEERRKSRRLKINLTVLYQIDKPLNLRMMIGWNREVSAVMLDLSDSGMSILTEYDIPKSTLLLIKFTLINLGGTVLERIKTMSISGEVRYSLPAEYEQHRLGIQFTNIEEGDKAAIADFVNTALKKGG
jgi:c-di-GMP-binding flagellar brake protein YcgR